MCVMRTFVDLHREQIDTLLKLSERRGSSVSTLIREAVSEYLDRQQPGGIDEAFGLWRTDELEDGVAYQRRLRAEWE